MISVDEAMNLDDVRLTQQEESRVAKYEEMVDEAIRKRFGGGPFRVEIDAADITARALMALKRNYERGGWRVEVSSSMLKERQMPIYGVVFSPPPATPDSVDSMTIGALVRRLSGGAPRHTAQVSHAPAPRPTVQPQLPATRSVVPSNARPLPSTPVLSIVFGTYNRFPLLRKAVESVRSSVGDLPYEIIVCDGGSTDGSRAWLAAQPDVVLLGERRLEGAVKAFNHCFREARGEFIANLNDDCVVEGDALAQGVAHLRAYLEAGQVAFSFAMRSGETVEEWHINDVYKDVAWPTTYVNFGITRKAAADQVAAICGGFWNPIYKTYAGDCELSAWILRLGWTISRRDDLRVIDVRNSDSLRDRNSVDSGAEAKLFEARWPPEAFRPDGPLPNVSPEERAKYEEVKSRRHETTAPVLDMSEVRAASIGWPEPAEEARLLAQARRVRSLDPAEGRLPKRAEALPDNERVLHVSLCTDADPQAGLVRALRRLGACGYSEVRWWADYGSDRDARQRKIIEEAAALRPTVVFMQLQAPGAIDVETVRAIRKVADPKCAIATWSGDIASDNSPWNVDWQVPIGRACDLTLHASLSHVHVLRALGVHTAAYLQIGYDPEQYRPRIDAPADFDVSFLGSRYDGDVFSRSMRRHDAKLRDDAVAALRAAFGDRFGLFGNGWGEKVNGVPLAQAHDVYQRSMMGLNVSLSNDLDCYSSDRLHRIIGCGALLLTKSFPMMSTYGLVHGENCLVWETPEDAVTLAREAVSDPDAAAEVAAAGATLAVENHTWDVRMLELMPLVEAARERMA